jgi:hypothetical protein
MDDPLSASQLSSPTDSYSKTTQLSQPHTHHTYMHIAGGIGGGAQVSPRDPYDYAGAVLNPLATVTTTASSTSTGGSAPSSGGTRVHVGKKRVKNAKSPVSDDDDAGSNNEEREYERRFQNNARER